MSNLKAFSYNACIGVMQGSYQELGIKPELHYVPRGYNAARVVSLRLTHINPHYLKQIRSMRDELTMWANLSDRTPVRIAQDGQAVMVEIPKPGKFWQKVSIEDLETRRFIRKGMNVTLGLGIQDNPERINFASPAVAHIGIFGQTRSGKTNAQKVIGWGLAHNTTPDECQFLIFEVAKKGYKWSDFAQVSHLTHPVIVSIEEAEKVLCWLVQEIDRRAENHQTQPQLFILIDELKALIDDSEVATTYLNRIAAIGAEFGLRLVVATQYPQIKLLKSAELKRNIVVRLCGAVDSSDAAYNALGVPDSGAEALQGYGDFLFKNLGRLARLTVAKVESRHVEQLPRGISKRLELPHDDDVNAGPKVPARTPDPLEPEQVALALYQPMGINKLQRQLRVGSGKASRIISFANAIRQWAIENNFIDQPIPQR